MKRITLVMLMLCVFTGWAQITITGTVSDAAGNPIAFANVAERGTENGTTTSVNGDYSITVAEDAVLVFSFVGYQSQNLPATASGSLNVTLQEGDALDEVVITALGIKRQERELGYAVQTLDTEDIQEVKSVNLVDNLQGKVAGITVTPGATGVGSSSKITIRGEASFSNNNPLFIVDGTPINNNSVFNFTNEAAAGFQEVDFGNGAGEINQDDIASVSVLKGPAAAALYGTRAANGAIIIETKSGGKKRGLGVSFNTSFFMDSAFKLPEFQNEFGQGNSGQFEYVDGLGGGINDNISYSWGPRLDQGTLIPQFDSPVTLPDGTVVRGGDTALYSGLDITPTPFVSHPDNLKNFYETGYTAINNIAVSNGFEKGDYRLSFTDLRSESIIPGVNLDRQTVAAKLNFRPSDKTRINASINYVNSESDNRPSNGYGSENVNYSLVAWGPRSLNIDSLRDYWQPGLEGVQQYSFNYTFFDNPYFILKENRNSFGRDRLFGNISISQELTSELTATVRTGMDYSNEKRRFLRNYSSNRFRNGAYAEHDVFYREINTDFLLNYQKQFGDFSFDASAGGNRLNQTAQTTQIQTTSLAQPGIFSLNNAASPIETFGFTSEKRINSLYAFAKAGYKNFLYLDVTARNDWSSALATPFTADNTSFFYPSVSTSFILSNVVELPRVIDFAKIRASYAEVGNDTSPYQTQGTFLSQTPVNSQPTFSNQDFIPNANLKPETTSSIELGFDVRFLKQRLNLDFTYYNAVTDDQILSLPIAISSGFSQQVVNGGSVRNQGVEIILNAIPVQNTNFEWSATANFASSRAIVESLPQEDGRLTLGLSRVYDNSDQTVFHQVEEGGRVGDLYGTGYIRNEDGQFILTPAGRFIADPELRKLGNYNADFQLGLTNSFRYKDFDASFLLDWRQGGILVSRTLALGAVGGQLNDTSFRPEEGIVADGVINTGTPENPVYVQNTTAVTAESYYRQFYDRNHEENNVYDASYLKLRQFSIGYNFELKDGAFGIFGDGADLRVSLIGRNLFAISEIPHFDPEQLAVQGQGFVNGVEDMSYASTRSIGLKAGINF
ncbi:TonB-linked outer membrane protein, SusC/RagA family [Nonlabens sp. Hel1_33_55]|uniref:SusC/RagA family TonB-linked outer membrane protein n=1 Tax=Nonlabens sp. Hel1_33_55 TaxID=1336802 RepID=UPI000875B5B1|nr:SusC/RagA family TonB-linked outer membrane protein [Nonlabens sp. Hel1_33_55]SCY42978.1 TonB-linked outer membrane protein, SusC/RagA family [Nonlabens sp. Hel1_33_55]